MFADLASFIPLIDAVFDRARSRDAPLRAIIDGISHRISHVEPCIYLKESIFRFRRTRNEHVIE